MSATTMAIPTIRPITSAHVPSTGANTIAAMGAQTAALTMSQRDGLRRSRYDADAGVGRSALCISLGG